MIVTQIRPRRRSCCSNLVLRHAPRPHDMKLRQHGLRSWPCWLPNAGKHSPVKTAREGTPHEKSSSPVRAAFFVVLIGVVFPCYIAQRYRFVTQPAASCQAPGDLLVLHLKIDIFCHLSIFFLTSAYPTLIPASCRTAPAASQAAAAAPVSCGPYTAPPTPGPDRRCPASDSSPQPAAGSPPP